VRQALALACDKKTIVDAIYKKTGEVANNLLYNPPQYNSPNTTSAYDLNQANQLLDQAGYARSGQYRAKGGVPLAVLYQTTVNQVRQQTQEVVKAGWEKLGVKTELKSIDAGIFFSSDAGNPDSGASLRRRRDVHQRQRVAGPVQLHEGADHRRDRAEGEPVVRQQLHALVQQGRRRGHRATAARVRPAKRAELFIKANDIEVNDYAEIPLVYRPSVIGVIKGLQVGPGTPWDSQLWNVANWVKR
jgi:peptide/nickel transport system substrate-binding protein